MAVVDDPKSIDLINAAAESGEKFIAFEYYPPRTEDGLKNLYARLGRMSKHAPSYIDFTWGAGGATSDLTLELCVESKKRYGYVPNMHLTCTNMVAEKITIALEGAKAAGIRNIVALRGDPPAGEEAWEAVEGGFTCGLDLVKHIRAEYGDYFGISVAGYPEGHPSVIKEIEDDRELSDAEKLRVVDLDGKRYVCSDADFDAELDYLKSKVDAGADFIITQMFFDIDTFNAFVEAARAKGITCPIVPGLMLIQSYGGFCRMTAFCKSRVPAELRAGLEEVKDDKDAVRAYGIAQGTAMCKKLIEAGVSGLHFYTLNLEKVTEGILTELGMGFVREPVEDATAEERAAAEAAAAAEAGEEAAAPADA